MARIGKTSAVGLSLLLLLFACKKDDSVDGNYKEEMRNLVIGISQYGKSLKQGFIVIPQNGQEIITTDGELTSSLSSGYLNAIDGQGREDLFYGYDTDDELTREEDKNYLIGYLDKLKQNGKVVLVTDYCATPAKMNSSYVQNNQKGYVSFAANHRDLDNIPTIPSPIYQENNLVITQLSQAKNFLYLLDPSNYTKAQFINAVSNTNYDVLITDLFVEGIPFTSQEIAALKQKKNGGKRLVICYMSIGEAEDYRYYWQSSWKSNKPAWLDAVNPDWPGNYKVRYWDKEWQNILFGNDQSYLKKIITANFDGVYLDIIDAFEYYE
jgi:cysteinyl-tRNA synthetase, unknown class